MGPINIYFSIVGTKKLIEIGAFVLGEKDIFRKHIKSFNVLLVITQFFGSQKGTHLKINKKKEKVKRNGGSFSSILWLVFLVLTKKCPITIRSLWEFFLIFCAGHYENKNFFWMTFGIVELWPCWVYEKYIKFGLVLCRDYENGQD